MEATKMAHPYHHALSSVKKWGGTVKDYLAIHSWFDASKAFLADLRHRALRHHAEGIFWAEEVFGPAITNSAGRLVPVRWIGEQHVKEDLGWIPTLQDWFKHLRVQPWMAKAGDRQVGRGEVAPEPAYPTASQPHGAPAAKMRKAPTSVRNARRRRPGQ
jgi:hypothetical protein